MENKLIDVTGNYPDIIPQFLNAIKYALDKIGINTQKLDTSDISCNVIGINLFDEAEDAVLSINYTGSALRIGAHGLYKMYDERVEVQLWQLSQRFNADNSEMVLETSITSSDNHLGINLYYDISTIKSIYTDELINIVNNIINTFSNVNYWVGLIVEGDTAADVINKQRENKVDFSIKKEKESDIKLDRVCFIHQDFFMDVTGKGIKNYHLGRDYSNYDYVYKNQ